MTVHRTLPEAIDSVINPTNVRWDLDNRSFAMIAGLSRRPLTEVYQGKESDFYIDDSEAGRIHSLLEIPKINHSGAAHEEEVLLGGGRVFELHPRPTHVGGFEDPLYVWKATKGLRHLAK